MTDRLATTFNEHGDPTNDPPVGRLRTRVEFLVGQVLALGIAALAIVGYLAAPYVLEVWCCEDGFVEWATVVVYLAAFGLLIRSAAKRYTRPRTYRLLLAILFLLVALEELNWGQRILGVPTPDFLASANVQGEISLHNLAGIHGTVRAAAVLFALGYCILIPAVAMKSSRLRTRCDEIGLPLFPIAGIIYMVTGIALMAAPRILLHTPHYELDEVGELLFAVAFLHLAWVDQREHPHRAESSDAAQQVFPVG